MKEKIIATLVVIIVLVMFYHLKYNYFYKKLVQETAREIVVYNELNTPHKNFLTDEALNLLQRDFKMKDEIIQQTIKVRRLQVTGNSREREEEEKKLDAMLDQWKQMQELAKNHSTIGEAVYRPCRQELTR